MAEPDDIETHYRQSAFIEEVCVLERHAVVVPNMALIRKKKIVNVGDILRFEMEGRTVGLPSHQHILSYDVWFEPLPRTAAGEIKRDDVERIVRERLDAAGAPLPADDHAWLADPHAAAAAAADAAAASGRCAHCARGQPRDRPGTGFPGSCRARSPSSSIDSRCTCRARPRGKYCTVRQLIDAVRPIDPKGLSPRAESAPVESWAAVLEDLPPDTDPVLSGLLERKPFAAPLLYLALRLLRMVLGRADVSGLESLPASGPFILCPNHQSYLDPMFICSVLPYGVFRRLFYIGAVEYFETPLTKWVARNVNLLPVDPDSNLLPAMKACAFGLKHGKILVLFPEGERSIDGTVKKFKKGVAILARHSRVPIVPVALKGVYELWPRNRAFNWSVLWPWSRHRFTVAFGPPMTVGESETYSEAALRLRDRVDAMWRAMA